MGLWTFLAICVVCGCALEAYRAYTKSKAARSSQAAQAGSPRCGLGNGPRGAGADPGGPSSPDPKADLGRKINDLAG